MLQLLQGLLHIALCDELSPSTLCSLLGLVVLRQCDGAVADLHMYSAQAQGYAVKGQTGQCD